MGRKRSASKKAKDSTPKKEKKQKTGEEGQGAASRPATPAPEERRVFEKLEDSSQLGSEAHPSSRPSSTKKPKNRKKKNTRMNGQGVASTHLYTDNDRKRDAKDLGYRPEMKKQSEEKTFVGGDDFNRDLARVVHSASFRRLRNKAQLFPTTESDAFRTRLTHSQEVSQIAQGLAKQAAALHPELEDISLDLINMAALAHDIGHPPFGHNGERELNEWMKDAGGFEGNAQNLRVLARLEKKRKPNGLNLTYRSLAAVLKKDAEIGQVIAGETIKKGYYRSERDLVAKIKKHVIGDDPEKDLRTIECAIMDAADDIAYATYDLEDSLKGGFMSPMDMLACNHKLAEKVRDKIRKDPEAAGLQKIEVSDVQAVLRKLALEGLDHVQVRPKKLDQAQRERNESSVSVTDDADNDRDAYVADVYKKAKKLAENSRFRTSFTSALVNGFMRGVKFEVRDPPCLSQVSWEKEALKRVMVLKHFTFFFVIKTPQIQAWEANGRNVVSEICRLLWADKEGSNLPPDWRSVFKNAKAKLDEVERSPDKALFKATYLPEGVVFKRKVSQVENRLTKAEAIAEAQGQLKRVICDFVAGMTDTYAVEFYGRLTSLQPTTIFKKV